MGNQKKTPTTTFLSLSVSAAHEAEIKLLGQTQWVVYSKLPYGPSAPPPAHCLFRQGWLGYPELIPPPPEDAVPACSQPPPFRKIRCGKVVDHSLLIHNLGDLRHNINQSSPEGPPTYAGAASVPCMGQDVESLKAVQRFVTVPSISHRLSPESRVWAVKG